MPPALEVQRARQAISLEERAMNVSAYMTPRPVTINRNFTAENAASLMRRHQVFQLPVVDDNGKLVGIVTDRDIRSTAGSDLDLLKKFLVSEIMTADVVRVGPDENIRMAIEILYRLRIGGLPVVEDDEVVGIITVRDLLRCLRDELEMPPILHEVSMPRQFADIF